VMGSFPYPRNGLIEIDYEFILLFKKLGTAPPVSQGIKKSSALSKEEWRQYFTGHWNFAGEKQNGGHLAVFPEELPKRLIKMFSFVGETVLDPFLGSGTTTKVAAYLSRKSIGYEINKTYLPVIKKKIGVEGRSFFGHSSAYEIIFQKRQSLVTDTLKSARKVAPAILSNRIRSPEFWKTLQKKKISKVSA